ncbi:MAG: glutamyl-tRNA reductase, partial [Polyangia bacterium]
MGLSHKTAPIEVRERVAFAGDALPASLKRLVTVPGVGEAMIVSTCNRVELYAGVDDAAAMEAMRR